MSLSFFAFKWEASPGKKIEILEEIQEEKRWTAVNGQKAVAHHKGQGGRGVKKIITDYASNDEMPFPDAESPFYST